MLSPRTLLLIKTRRYERISKGVSDRKKICKHARRARQGCFVCFSFLVEEIIKKKLSDDTG